MLTSSPEVWKVAAARPQPRNGAAADRNATPREVQEGFFPQAEAELPPSAHEITPGASHDACAVVVGCRSDAQIESARAFIGSWRRTVAGASDMPK